MRHAGIVLLVASALLAVGSLASNLVRAASGDAHEQFIAPAPIDTPTPSFFVYLPLMLRHSGTAWVTIVEEGFETPPGSLWSFWDADGASNGLYYWARRQCAATTGEYSAWAVGGGDGAALGCGSHYPDNVDSWMTYGPFSLEDAAGASLSFRLRLNVDPVLNDTLYVLASSNDANYYGISLTYQPADWAPLTFPLDDNLLGVDMRGQPQVWIAFVFASDGSVNFPEGAYVDDVVVRKCVGGPCPPLAGSSSAAPAGRRAVRTLGSSRMKSPIYSSGR